MAHQISVEDQIADHQIWTHIGYTIATLVGVMFTLITLANILA